MKKELTGVAARVLPVIEPAVTAAGCFVWDIDYVREGADRILRITIDTDSENGVGIEECEKVHRAVDPLLDEADPIDCSYYLQISSPGVERDITLPRHVVACIGERVEARLFAPIDGRKVVTGTLMGFVSDENEDGNENGSGSGNGNGSGNDPQIAPRPVQIDAAGETVTLPYESISKMKVLFDFGA